MKPVLIYDDKCGPCAVFASGGKKESRAIVLGYSTSKAQRLMEAQFGKEYGFTLMLFTEHTVYWGNAAAKEYVRLGYNAGLQKTAEVVYPFIVRILNVVLRRKRLPAPPHIEGEELRQWGSRPLTPAAQQELRRIQEEYEEANA